ncbi:C2H2 type zinc-finger-domain-containing protein [Lentinula aff. detonsa]|uniref:C2H2 type zinc-finger-domain-containing protein n=1 Tax=Lentinula aff. detonsa TaxID=2804958 RepID=A0AA38NNM5_9AGAR|nr:C2H2 type zinc-finger-domain-containing protein [Lentinula aff. detonsa]
MEEQEHSKHLFTCISCSIAFVSAEEQRVHYRSDHHRYNMKRRVAGLPPVSVAVFNEKVNERRMETAIMSSLKGSMCEVCNKTYSTENAYRSHLNSKKHKENELQASLKLAYKLAKKDGLEAGPEDEVEAKTVEGPPSSEMASLSISEESRSKETSTSLVVDDSEEEQINQTIDQKIAAARSRLSPAHCLFCPAESSELQANLLHMASVHSFFIPDADYLVDAEGLIGYLGEKIAVGNVCIFCNEKSREFRTLDAVRKHMLDKSHCKVAYDKQDDRLEISDYYDFTSSYPDAHLRKKKAKAEQEKDEEWEDSDGDVSEVDEIMEIEEDEEESEISDEDDPNGQATYGDSQYELVLPSGARIGHRSMRRYYAQSFPGTSRDVDPNSGAAIVRRLLGDKNSLLVPRKGGFGAFGAGTDVVKARNRGEAREAGRHVREFRDQARRENFKTKVGFRHNSQKHYRDPLLQ